MLEVRAPSRERRPSPSCRWPSRSPGPHDIYEAGGVVYMTQPLDRPEALPGQTYKLRWPESDHAIYITINDIVQDGRRRPFEVFINSKNMEHYAWTVGLTRMITAVFRRGGDVSFVVEELKAVFDPRGGHWMDGHYVPSLLAAIGEVIEHHMIDIGFIAGRGAPGRCRSARSPTCRAARAPARRGLCRPAPNAASPRSSARKAATSAPPAAIRSAASGQNLTIDTPCDGPSTACPMAAFGQGTRAVRDPSSLAKAKNPTSTAS